MGKHHWPTEWEADTEERGGVSGSRRRKVSIWSRSCRDNVDERVDDASEVCCMYSQRGGHSYGRYFFFPQRALALGGGGGGGSTSISWPCFRPCFIQILQSRTVFVVIIPCSLRGPSWRQFYASCQRVGRYNKRAKGKISHSLATHS